MNKLEFQAITWSFLKARKKSRIQDVIGFGFGFGFASHWLKNWRAIFAPTSYFRKSFENCSVVKKKKIETAIKFVLNNVKHCNLETCANSRLILCGKCYQNNVFFSTFLVLCLMTAWLQSNAEWRCNRYALTQHPYGLYFNWLFSSSPWPLFQGESKCEVLHEYQSKFILYRVITVTKNSHGDSLWNIDWLKLWMVSPTIYQKKCGGVLQFLLKMKTLTGVKSLLLRP